MENDKEQKRREAARKRPVRTPDASILEGRKPLPSKPAEGSQKYSGGLLKPGEGEHFERGRQRMQSYRGIDAMPHSSDALQDKLTGLTSGRSEVKVKKSGCMGVVLLAAALPLAAVVVALLR